MEENKTIIKKEDVTYDAILLDDKSVEILINLCKDNNLDISEPQENMHMTIAFYGNTEISNLAKAIKKAEGTQQYVLQEQLNELYKEKANKQLNNKELGNKVVIDATELGVYYKDGIPMNVGVKINDKYFSDIDLGCGRTLDDVSKNNIAHVTIYVNSEAKAKAINTQKCFGEGLEEGETFETFKFDKNIELTGDTRAFKFNLHSTELEGFPLDSEKNPNMTMDEVENSEDFYDSLKAFNIAKKNTYNL